MQKITEAKGSLPLIILSFAIVYIVWGAAYLFVLFAVEEIPPFLMAGSRFLVATALTLLVIAITRKFQLPTKIQTQNALFAGMLFLGLGTGGVAWALQFLDSGFAALFIAGEPLVIVFMMWGFNQKRPPLKSFLGVFLGMLGVYLLVSQQETVSGAQDWKGILAIIISMLSWGYATIFVSRGDLPKSQMMTSALQMLAGGILLLIFSKIVGEPSVDWFKLSAKTWFSLGFLVLFGGIIVFTAFNYLLKTVSPDKVATSAYVNPIIALFLGWWLNNEVLTFQSLIAAFILLLGVFFINTSKAEQS